MGLETSHGCWYGAYSAFDRFRHALTEAAGMGNLDHYEGFGGTKEWPDPAKEPMVHLLYHSDCDGDLEVGICGALADRMTELLPALREQVDGGGHVGRYAGAAERFIHGLRDAVDAGENVEFF